MKILSFCIVVFLLVGAYSACHTIKPLNCDVLYRCSDEDIPVWTTNDGHICEVFRNACYLRSKNCELLSKNEPQYKTITKSKCQELCREMACLAVFQPVCGSYNGKFMTFGNDCEMKRHICTTGETYSLYKEEACPEDAVITT